jgi:hypothetical protein
MHTSKWVHLNRTYKDVGDMVFLGDHIADYGPSTSGFSTGPHLHLSVIKDRVNSFTLLSIERGEHQSDKDALYRMWTNRLFGGPYKTTTLYLESGYKQKYGQNLYEHWGLDGVKLVENDYKIYWPLHVPGIIVGKDFNDQAGLHYYIQFHDDITGHWAEEAIKWMVDSGRMSGYEDGCFAPDRHLTRAEYAMAEWRKMR